MFNFIYVFFHFADLVDVTKIAPIKTFCGCMSLNTGCMIIGILGVLGCVKGFITRPSVIYIVDAFSCIALLVGLKTKNRYYLLPYIIWNSIGILALSLILYLIIIFSIVVFELAEYPAILVIMPREIASLNIAASAAIALIIAFSILGAFLLLVVYSHFIELREKQERENVSIPRTLHAEIPN